MALLHVDFKSDALHEAVQMNVLLPDKSQYPAAAEPKKYPVLYLLHGLSDDHTIWERRTRIESYVAGKDLIVVMPNSNRAWYTNTASGLKYFDLMAYELPRICKAYFPVAEGRENTFVAGLSMGGYGAFKLALTLPEQYAAAASLSGALDIAGIAKRRANAGLTDEFQAVFGRARTYKGTEHDVYALAEKVIASEGPKPKLFMACGTEDGLLRDSRLFRRRYGKDFDLTYMEGPGIHNWDFWDTYIRKVLAWLPM